MSNTQMLLTDEENNNGKIYLVLNRTHGDYTILTHGNYDVPSFFTFLEELYREIKVDDYEISHKYLVDANLTNKIVNYLHDIYKSNTFTFTMNNKINTSNDFFKYLNQLLVNHIGNIELLTYFTLFEPEKQNMCNSNEKQKQNSFHLDRIPCKSGRGREEYDYKPDKIQEKKYDDKDAILPSIYDDKDAIIPSILPYNHYDDTLKNNTDANIKIYTQFIPLKSPWEENELIKITNKKKNNIYVSDNENSIYNIFQNENTEDYNFNKCAILYCVSQNIGIVVENQNNFVEYLTKHFKDFELVKTYNKLDKKEFDNIKHYFHKIHFESNEIILKKINSFEILFEITNDKKTDIVNNEIEQFIREKYEIDNEPKHMIKASNILECIISNLQYFQYFNKDKNQLTKELSRILHNMGLKKIRKSDGIYYCGIVLNPNLFLGSGGNVEDMFKQTVKERNKPNGCLVDIKVAQMTLAH